MSNYQNVKNFLTQDEMNSLKEIVHKEFNSREVLYDDGYHAYHPDMVNIQPNFGRAVLGGLMEFIPQGIIDKATSFAKDHWIHDHRMKMTGVTFMRWAKGYRKDGKNPDLEVHVDYDNELGILLDYQLESSIPWGLAVEDRVYEMEDNEMVYFYPTIQYHWREIKDFGDDDFVDVIFFEYAGLGLSPGKRDSQKEGVANDMRNNLAKEKGVKNV